MAFNLGKPGTLCVGWNLISAFAMPVGSKNRIGELHIRVNEAVLLLFSAECIHQPCRLDVRIGLEGPAGRDLAGNTAEVVAGSVNRQPLLLCHTGNITQSRCVFQIRRFQDSQISIPGKTCGKCH